MDPPDILAMLRKIEDRGALEMDVSSNAAAVWGEARCDGVSWSCMRSCAECRWRGGRCSSDHFMEVASGNRRIKPAAMLFPGR
jgi:hypothetical protein